MSIMGGKGEQLKMFMSPREIESRVQGYGDFGMKAPGRVGENSYGTPTEAMERLDSGMLDIKRARTEKSGMALSVALDGVHKPIELKHGAMPEEGRGEAWVENGHHRLINQSDADPDRLMPVVHHTPSTRWRPQRTRESGEISQFTDPTGSKYSPLQFSNW